MGQGSKGVAVVSGGSSGIGEAAARRLAAAGHPVAILDIDAKRSKAVAADIANSAGVKARAYIADVSDAEAQEALAPRIETELGPIEVLVTSAGILVSTDALMTMDLAEHDRLWRINYHGTVHSIRAFGRAMQAHKRGAIVTLGSINSFAPLPLPAYNPSKAAIYNLTQIAAMELGRHGIRVNSVAPTFTLTPALKARIDKGERDVDAIKRLQAIDVMVEPRHIAEAIAFLCSESAAAITGIMLPIDAGYLAAISYKTYAGGVPWQE
jgi:NAD(P)-dependent dehydrogenase (short-subunit alcohol dehydrogenase family)